MRISRSSHSHPSRVAFWPSSLNAQICARFPKKWPTGTDAASLSASGRTYPLANLSPAAYVRSFPTTQFIFTDAVKGSTMVKPHIPHAYIEIGNRPARTAFLILMGATDDQLCPTNVGIAKRATEGPRQIRASSRLDAGLARSAVGCGVSLGAVLVSVRPTLHSPLGRIL